MIDPKELRLKNKVKTKVSRDTAIYEVMGIDFATHTVRLSDVRKYEWHPYDKLLPIPLTPEVLESCGFVFAKENNSYQLDIDLGFSIWGRPHEGLNVFVKEDEVGAPVYSLHQLQNLYFALIGKELEINVLTA